MDFLVNRARSRRLGRFWSDADDHSGYDQCDAAHPDHRTAGTMLFHTLGTGHDVFSSFLSVDYGRHDRDYDHANSQDQNCLLAALVGGYAIFGRHYRVSPPITRLHGHSSPVWSASSTRSVSSGERPTLRLLTVTCCMTLSGSTMNVARSAAPAGA